jgi:hypothetical protein
MSSIVLGLVESKYPVLEVVVCIALIMQNGAKTVKVVFREIASTRVRLELGFTLVVGPMKKGASDVTHRMYPRKGPTSNGCKVGH